MPESSAQEPSLPHVPATVADIMRPPLTTVQPNDHVAAAAYLMRHEAATALVVLDGQTNRPMGLVTEADIVQMVADGRDADAVRIYDLMTTRLSVIKATVSISEAANIMITGRFRHLPVIHDWHVRAPERDSAAPGRVAVYQQSRVDRSVPARP